MPPSDSEKVASSKGPRLLQKLKTGLSAMALSAKRQTIASVSRDGCAERESLSEEDMIRTSMEKLSEVVRLLQAE
eukprot:1924457-Prymnesium_polylepis.1